MSFTSRGEYYLPTPKGNNNTWVVSKTGDKPFTHPSGFFSPIPKGDDHIWEYVSTQYHGQRKREIPILWVEITHNVELSIIMVMSTD